MRLLMRGVARGEAQSGGRATTQRSRKAERRRMRGTAREAAHGQAVESIGTVVAALRSSSNDRRTQVKARRRMKHRAARVATGKRWQAADAVRGSRGRQMLADAGRWRGGGDTAVGVLHGGQQAGSVGDGGMTVKAPRSSRGRQAGGKGDEAAAGSQRSSRDRQTGGGDDGADADARRSSGSDSRQEKVKRRRRLRHHAARGGWR